MRKNETQILILGNNVVGKTTLIQRLDEIIFQFPESNSLKRINEFDWVIKKDKYNVYVELKERVRLFDESNNDNIFRIQDNSIVIIIVKPKFGNEKSSINSQIAFYIKDIPDSCIVIILFNSDRSAKTLEINEEVQKQFSDKIREVLWCNLIKDDFS